MFVVIASCDCGRFTSAKTQNCIKKLYRLASCSKLDSKQLLRSEDKNSPIASIVEIILVSYRHQPEYDGVHPDKSEKQPLTTQRHQGPDSKAHLQYVVSWCTYSHIKAIAAPRGTKHPAIPNETQSMITLNQDSAVSRYYPSSASFR